LTETVSLAANANISAQDTVPGHLASNASLMSSMTSKPAKDKLGMESFSAVLVAVESSKTEPSQPWNVVYNHVMWIIIYVALKQSCMEISIVVFKFEMMHIGCN